MPHQTHVGKCHAHRHVPGAANWSCTCTCKLPSPTSLPSNNTVSKSQSQEDRYPTDALTHGHPHFLPLSHCILWLSFCIYASTLSRCLSFPDQPHSLACFATCAISRPSPSSDWGAPDFLFDETKEDAGICEPVPPSASLSCSLFPPFHP